MTSDPSTSVPQWEVPVWGDQDTPETDETTEVPAVESASTPPLEVPAWGSDEPQAMPNVPEWNEPLPAIDEDIHTSLEQPTATEQDEAAEQDREESRIATEVVGDEPAEPEIPVVVATTAEVVNPTHRSPSTTRRPRRKTGSSQNTLSWQDVSNIFDFSERYEELSEAGRAALADLTDLPRDSHPVEIAEALYPAGGDLAAFTFMLEVVGMVNGGEISFADGARLVNKVDSLPDPVAKSFARQVSGLTGVDIKHRRNSVTLEFVALVLDSIDKTRQNGGLETLIEIKEILDIWPGGKK